jgi:hypothetical protein
MQGMVYMVYVNSVGLNDPEFLRTWVERGTSYVVRHPAAPKRRTRT